MPLSLGVWALSFTHVRTSVPHFVSELQHFIGNLYTLSETIKRRLSSISYYCSFCSGVMPFDLKKKLAFSFRGKQGHQFCELNLF